MPVKSDAAWTAGSEGVGSTVQPDSERDRLRVQPGGPGGGVLMFVWRQPHPRAKRAGRRGSGGWYPMDPLAGERENARRHVFDTRARGETAQAERHFDKETSRQCTIGRRGPNSQPAQCKERVVAGRLRVAASRPAGGPFRLKRTDVLSESLRSSVWTSVLSQEERRLGPGGARY